MSVFVFELGNIHVVNEPFRKPQTPYSTPLISNLYVESPCMCQLGINENPDYFYIFRPERYLMYFNIPRNICNGAH